MKKEFRKFCINTKRVNRYYFSKEISKRVHQLCKPYKKILLFIPLKNEANINSLIKKLRREKKSVFVPFMEDLSFKMVKYQLPLTKKKFSIIEPINKQKTLEKIDLAIIPVVGIDKSFRRVGFGKGIYDRFFEKLKFKPKKVVFVQLKPCISKEILAKTYDIQADEFISFKINKRRKNEHFNSFSPYDYIRSCGSVYSKKNGKG